MNILCIETSSTNCSVAIARESGGFKNSLNINSCLDLIEDQSDQYSHGERLHVFIDEILKKNQLQASDLSAIAISAGPGSYTGLRIGVASAKGLCYALNIPLISIDTLTALSLQDTSDSDYTLAFLDARRMEVYASVFKNKNCVQSPEAVVLTTASFSDYFNDGSACVIGTGVTKFQDLLNRDDLTVVPTNPTALTMCDMALEKMNAGDTVTDIAYFEPFYLKEFKV